MEHLIEVWKQRLARFLERPEVAKGMDDKVAMGVQHGRVSALRECLQELEQALRDQDRQTVLKTWLAAHPDAGADGV